MFNAPVKTHSELSPSNAERWWNCPGSVALCRTVPRPPQSAYAKEGEVAHTLLERCLKNADGFLNPFDFEGSEIEGIEITEEMCNAVSIVIDFVNLELQKGGVLTVETKVEVMPGISGTLDIRILRVFDRLIIADFKYGAGVAVHPRDNKQLLLYALAEMRRYEVKTVELVIIQPRVFGNEPVARWECGNDYIETFEAEFKRHVALTEDPMAMCISGSWCKFCSAKTVCPALRKDLSTALAPVKNSELLFPDAKTLPMNVIVKLLENTDKIEDWLKTVWGYAQEILEGGGDVPGYALTKKKGHRKWIDEAKVAALFQELGDKLFTAKIISPAKLEKLVDSEKKKIIETLTEVPDNGLTITKSFGGGKLKGSKK